MQYQIVPFEDIDKNKWNGSVHYAPHGNVFGYYWYLRSVMKEWDAIIEGDYQSVMPLPRYSLSKFEWSLLPSLGPYSVNAITAARSKTFFEMWKDSGHAQYYPFNSAWSVLLYPFSKELLLQDRSISLNLGNDYDTLFNQYSKESQLKLYDQMNSEYIYHSFNKPEQFLENISMNHHERNTLYRLFYNAIQRGAGYHTRIVEKDSGKMAECFLISDQRNIYLPYINEGNDSDTELKLIDTLLKSQAGKPVSFRLPEKLASIWKKENLIHDNFLFMPHKSLSMMDRIKAVFKI
jgi:hypothetical protein